MDDILPLGLFAAVLLSFVSLSAVAVEGSILEHKSTKSYPQKLEINQARQLLKRNPRAATASENENANAKHDSQVSTHEVVLNGSENHSYAYVHWCGNQSQAIIVLTVKYGRPGIGNSSVWRSLDYGASYSKLPLSDQAPISRFFVSPVDQSKMVFTDTQNKRLYTSTDEMTNYQNVSLPVASDDIQMHPQNSDWILLYYGRQRQLYLTMDFGRSWTLLESDVLGSSCWGLKGYDDPHVVHMEVQPQGSAQSFYKRFTVPDCKAPGDGIDNSLGPFMSYSLLVINEFIFVQKANMDGTNSHMMVSHDRGNFSHTYFPGNIPTMDFMVLDASEGQVFLAVIHGVERGASLYLSDQTGQYYVLSLSNVSHYAFYNDLFQVDFHKVEGVSGTYLANQLLDQSSDNHRRLRSLVSFNKGGTWLEIPSPVGQDCDFDNCSLLLRLDSDNYFMDPVFSEKEAPGFLIAHGHTGHTYETDIQNISIFTSFDGGWTWKKSPLYGTYHFIILDQGSIVTAVKSRYQQNQNASYIYYSYDEGDTWHHELVEVGNGTFHIEGTIKQPGIDSIVLSIYGREHYNAAWRMITFNFSQVLPRKCDDSSDYVNWIASDHDNTTGENCLLGQEISYRRRKHSAVCYNGEGFVRKVQKTACECGQEDFECDFGFSMHGSECKKESWFDESYIAQSCTEHQSYSKSKGYRKVGADKCVNGVANSTKYQTDTGAACPVVKPDHLLLTANETVVTTGQSVYFHLSQKMGSIHTTRYVWNFSNIHHVNSTGLQTSQQQTHRFFRPGVFDVKVIASNSAGKSQSNTVRITVETPIHRMAVFYNWAVRVGFPVHISVVTNNLYSHTAGSLHFLYQFGDESSTAKETLTWAANVSHIYNTSGTYTLSVSAINRVSVVTKQFSVAVIDDGVLLQLTFSHNASQLFGHTGSSFFRMRASDWLMMFREKLTMALGIRTNRLSLSLNSSTLLRVDMFVLPKSPTSPADEMTANEIAKTVIGMVNSKTLSFDHDSLYSHWSSGNITVTSVRVLASTGNKSRNGSDDGGTSDDHNRKKSGHSFDKAIYIGVPVLVVAVILAVTMVVVYRRRSQRRNRYSLLNLDGAADPFLDHDDLPLDMSDASDTGRSSDDALLNLGSRNHLVLMSGSSDD